MVYPCMIEDELYIFKRGTTAKGSWMNWTKFNKFMILLISKKAMIMTQGIIVIALLINTNICFTL
jgi:hypothetical protein